MTDVPTYGYFWFRHHTDASMFIACRDTDGFWYMPGVGHPLLRVEEQATLLGAVPRSVVGGGSIDH